MPSDEAESPAVEVSSPGPGAESEQLRRIVMATRDLPTMPHVASKVLALSSDPNSSASQLQKVIADDQAMAARILKIANSAMYSCSRKIKTLSEAIVMLGYNSIRSLVVTSASRNLYASGGKRMGLKERLLWEHSIGTALACRLLAQQSRPQLAEEAFLAGLMHDIGKLVLNQQASEQFDEIVQIVYNEHRMFAETEREILGFDHAEVGALIVSKWKLTPLLEWTIANHHNPAMLSSENPLLSILDLANGLCKRLGVGFIEKPDIDLAGSRAGQLLEFSAERIDAVAASLQSTLASEMDVFV